MELVEVTEKGPVKYFGRKRLHGQNRYEVASERVGCEECGAEFWRWVGAEGEVCGPCQREAKAES